MILKNSKLGINTSNTEGFCIAVNEMLVFMPVLLYDKGYDYVNEFKDVGVIFSSIEQALNLIKTLYFNEKAWEKVYINGTNWVKKTYSTEIVANEYKEIFNDFTVKNKIITDISHIKCFDKLDLKGKILSIQDIIKTLGWQHIVNAQPPFVRFKYKYKKLDCQERTCFSEDLDCSKCPYKSKGLLKW